MIISIKNKRPPPPHRGTFNHRLTAAGALLAVFLLYSCDNPSGSSAPSAPSEKSPPPTYTTTVSGRIVTPARAADPTKGSTIGTAEVWASTDPNRKVAAKADGTYSIEVTHAGTFGITSGYTGTDGNYKTSDEKTFKTADKTIDGENIALKYGYSTEFTGRVLTVADPRSISRNGAVVTVEVEGRVVGSTTAGGGRAEFSITFAHPGSFKIIARLTGFKDDVAEYGDFTRERWRKLFDLQP